jgi:hypothetical protein
MATVEDHKEIAFTELRMLVQPASTPELDDVELNSILDSAQRASFWILSTAFTFGAVVLPATKNGHRYKCTTAGTTAATEPTWPTNSGATITDGTVVWQEAGPDYDNVFDVRAAAHQAWVMKQAKASVLFDSSGQRASQIAEHCKQMADSLEPIKIA